MTTRDRTRRPGRLGMTLAVIAALLPPAAVGGGMLLASLQALAGLVAASTLSVARLREALLPALLPFLAFVAWTAASALWSPVERPEQAAKIIGAALTGALLILGVAHAREPDKALMRAGLAAALVVLIAYSAVEAAFDMPLNRLDEPDTPAGILERNPGKGVSILVVLLWAGLGALAGLRRWRWLRWAAIPVVAATAGLSLQFNMATNAAGFLVGLCGFALGALAPRIGPMVLSGLAAGWLVAAPWLTPLILRLPGMESGLPLSWRMRGEIWSFAAARIQERPLTGWGLDGARLFGDTILEIDGLPFRAIPLHPHSFSVHVWLETGAVGVLLLAVAILAAGRAASRACAGHPLAAAALCGAVGAIATIWNVSYGAWQEWWMATAFLALAWALALRRL